MAARSTRRILVPRSAPSPSLAEMRRADNLDVVIHAMRKRAPPSGRAESRCWNGSQRAAGCRIGAAILQPWAARRWHLREPQAGAKDKNGRPARPPIKGRSRLLAPFNEAQGSMIGGGDERALSIGNTLDAAISEGVFSRPAGRARERRGRLMTACCSMPSQTSWAVRRAMPRKRSRSDPRGSGRPARHAGGDRARSRWHDRCGSRAAVRGARSQWAGSGGGQQAAYGGSPTSDTATAYAIGTGEGAQAYGWGLYFAGKGNCRMVFAAR
jgi:hypothetical protein